MLKFESMKSIDGFRKDSMGKIISCKHQLSKEYETALSNISIEYYYFVAALHEELLSASVVEYKKTKLSKIARISVAFIDPNSEEDYWRALSEKLKHDGVHTANILSFDAEHFAQPLIDGIRNRTERWEYRIELSSYDLQCIHPKHRNVIRKAIKNNIRFQVLGSDRESLEEHTKLKQSSMRRRQHKGHKVSIPSLSQRDIAYIDSGAAVLFQACLNDNILSSAMVLESQNNAYLYSAGNSSQGMQTGSSNFLIHNIIMYYKNTGKSQFNLGGVRPSEKGLDSFKRRFEGDKILLSNYSVKLKRNVLKGFTNAVKTLAKSPKHFFSYYICRISRYEHYCTLTGSSKFKISTDNGFFALTNDQLSSLKNTEFHKTYRKYIDYGTSDGAYGYKQNGDLAHVSWLIDYIKEKHFEERNIHLSKDEAEVTHCYTAEAYRGKGIYPRMITFLKSVAQEKGYSSIHMITSISNRPSQRGMKKAGMDYFGSIYRIVCFPVFRRRLVLHYRSGYPFLRGRFGVKYTKI